jgi:hypothetical protein
MRRRVLIPLVLVCAALAVTACNRRHSLFMNPGENEDADHGKKVAAAPPSAPAQAASRKSSTL